MVRMPGERVLLIGDTSRELHNALVRTLPGAQVTAVGSIFDGIAELGGRCAYTAVIAPAEPIERRPEAAVRALRGLAGAGRVVLFGPAAMETVSRRMLNRGCDDYLVLPPDAGEIAQVFSTPALRLADAPTPAPPEAAEPLPFHDDRLSIDHPSVERETAEDARPAPVLPSRLRLPLADLFLNAMLHHPQDPVSALLRKLNEVLGPGMQLVYHANRIAAAGTPATDNDQDSRLVLSHAVRGQADHNNASAGMLDLLLGDDEDEAPACHFLAQVATLLSKLITLQDRHTRLQKLAITDEMTGLYNARYFRHFLRRIVEKGRKVHFPVTLLLFDIDDFKKYNDQFGHSVGDEILKETAALMRRCTREHDLVARIGGDEFAVVFWDKEGPRHPLHADQGTHSRPPQTPLQVFKRFQKLLATQEFPVLGKMGKGVLGISAGMAVFPYEAIDAAGLFREADHRLMQLAKKNGKNTINIVGAGADGAADPARSAPGQPGSSGSR